MVDFQKIYKQSVLNSYDSELKKNELESLTEDQENWIEYYLKLELGENYKIIECLYEKDNERTLVEVSNELDISLSKVRLKKFAAIGVVECIVSMFDVPFTDITIRIAEQDYKHIMVSEIIPDVDVNVRCINSFRDSKLYSLSDVLKQFKKGVLQPIAGVGTKYKQMIYAFIIENNIQLG